MKATTNRKGKSIGTVTLAIDGASYIYNFNRARVRGVEMTGFAAVGGTALVPHKYDGLACELVQRAIAALSSGIHNYEAEPSPEGWDIRVL